MSKENDDLFDMIRELKSKNSEFEEIVSHLLPRITYLEQLIEFWHGEVPLKYRKIFPKDGEYPFFKLKKPEGLVEEFGYGSKIHKQVLWPKDTSEFRAALERMKAYAQEKDKINEFYFVLYDENGSRTGEALSEEEADKWIKEGPNSIREYKYPERPEENFTIETPMRSKFKKWRKVLSKQRS